MSDYATPVTETVSTAPTVIERLTQLGDAVTSADAFVAAWQRAREQDPDMPVPGVCVECGGSTGATPADYVTIVPGYLAIPHTLCEPCVEKGKARFARDEQDQRDRALNGLIPAEFLRWDEGRGNTSLLAAARGRFAPEARKGIVLHGPTGTCKTRVAWMLVRDLVERGRFSWAWIDAYDAATAGFRSEHTNADVLFVDDLGNEPMSSKYETSFCRIVRYRCDRHKPLVITTQLNGHDFKARFFSGAGADAILRRLRDRTEMVSA